MMDMLVTGVGSGLGKYLRRRFGADGFGRGDTAEALAARRDGRPYDAVVHCAANARRGVTGRTLFGYLDDNLFLTRDLMRVPHRLFVQISSVAVYPSDGLAREEADIPIDEPRDLYQLAKLGGECIARTLGTDVLVLRVTGLLGIDARPNSVSRILTGPEPALTLSAASSFNYVLHRDVGDLVEHAVATGLTGTVNVAASRNVTLAEVAELAGRPVAFGGHTYRTPPIDNSRAAALHPAFRRTSLENVSIFRDLAAATP